MNNKYTNFIPILSNFSKIATNITSVEAKIAFFLNHINSSVVKLCAFPCGKNKIFLMLVALIDFALILLFK